MGGLKFYDNGSDLVNVVAELAVSCISVSCLVSSCEDTVALDYYQ